MEQKAGSCPSSQQQKCNNTYNTDNKKDGQVQRTLYILSQYCQLEKYKNIFVEQEIGYEEFLELTTEHLREMGITKYGPLFLIHKLIEQENEKIQKIQHEYLTAKF